MFPVNPRLEVEWFLCLIACAIGFTTLFWGDSRLGVYLLWIPGVTLTWICFGWALLLWSAALIQGAVLIRHHELRGAPRALRFRRYAALYAGCVWTLFAVTCSYGGIVNVGAPVAILFALSEYLLFLNLPCRSWN